MDRLDYETKTSYLLNVSATAVGVYSRYIPVASVTVNVTVVDVNDNEPTFSSGPGEVRMTVNARDLSPDVPIVTFHADDKDSGRNAAISYRLYVRGIYPYFRIDNKTGAVFPEPKLVAGEYLLQIEASNNLYGGNPIKNLYLTVHGSMTTRRPTTTTSTSTTTPTTTPTTTSTTTSTTITGKYSPRLVLPDSAAVQRCNLVSWVVCVCGGRGYKCV